MLAGHYLAATDLETSGLNHDTCEILQFGMRIVNLDGTYVDGCDLIQTYVSPSRPLVIGDNAEQGAIDMHVRTGLLAYWPATPPPSATEVDVIVSTYLLGLGFREYGRDSRLKILGRNPSFDEAFMRRFMPLTARLLHYRKLDTDVGELLFAIALNTGTGVIRRAFEGNHTVQGDIDSTVAEHRAMVEALRLTLADAQLGVPGASTTATRPAKQLDELIVTSTMTLAGPLTVKNLYIEPGALLHTNNHALVVTGQSPNGTLDRVVTP